MRKKNLFLILLTNIFILNIPVYAAENKSSGKIPAEKVVNSSFLTLSEAIDTAVQNNYSLKLSGEKIKLANYQITENAAQGLPQLNITASYGRQDPVNPPPPTAGLGNNPQFASFLGTARVNTFRNQVAVNQVLFAGFRIIDGVRLASINVELANEGYRQSRQEVVLNVSSSYYNSLKAYQLVQVNKSSLKQAQLHLEQAKKLEKAGVGIKLEVLRAANQLVNIQLQLSQALNSYEKSKKVLNLAMGRSIDYPIELNLEAKVPDVNIQNENQIFQDALKGRSELRQLNIKKEMDEIAATIQSRASWPMVSANVSYNLSDTSVVSANSVNNQNINYGINMNWPVFDGLLTYAKVQKSQNSVIQDQISIDQLQQSIILEVKQALLDIQEAKERILLAKEGISLGDESLRIAKIRYENGVGISLDVIDSQISLTQAQSNLVNAEFDLNISRVKLYKAIGIDI